MDYILRRASQVALAPKNPLVNAGDTRWEDPWSRKGQPSPVFLSGKCHAQGSLVDYSPQVTKESDRTELNTNMIP